MDWTHVLGIVLGNAAWTLPMFFWNRAEARADARQAAQDTKELRREMIDIMRELKEDGRIFREQWAAESKSFSERWAAECAHFNEKWAAESKDFHGRLCTIEERRIQGGK